MAERVWDEAVFSAGESCGIVVDLRCGGGWLLCFGLLQLGFGYMNECMNMQVRWM